MKNVMIDLETLGTDTNSVILSIGAVKFDPDTNELGEGFIQAVSIESNQAAGRTISADTLLWWMKQSDEARVAAFLRKTNSLYVALEALSDFLGNDALVWGNGADFDISMLADAYKSFEWQTPWKFWNVRCYRTMKNIPGVPSMTKRIGTHHNALDDAVSQAEHLMQIMQHLKGAARG